MDHGHFPTLLIFLQFPSLWRHFGVHIGSVISNVRTNRPDVKVLRLVRILNVSGTVFHLFLTSIFIPYNSYESYTPFPHYWHFYNFYRHFGFDIVSVTSKSRTDRPNVSIQRFISFLNCSVTDVQSFSAHIFIPYIAYVSYTPFPHYWYFSTIS